MPTFSAARDVVITLIVAPRSLLQTSLQNHPSPRMLEAFDRGVISRLAVSGKKARRKACENR